MSIIQLILNMLFLALGVSTERLTNLGDARTAKGGVRQMN